MAIPTHTAPALPLPHPRLAYIHSLSDYISLSVLTKYTASVKFFFLFLHLAQIVYLAECAEAEWSQPMWSRAVVLKTG